MDSRIQSYIRFAAVRWRETERVGPFLATFSASDNPYVNYAVPDDAARPSAADGTALVEAYERRGRRPRLEYVASTAPAVEAALCHGGFRVEGRLPLMTCTIGSFRELPAPDGMEIVAPRSHAEFAGVVSVTREAYAGDLSEATAGEISARRALAAAGGVVVLAFDRRTAEPAGSGICEVPEGGVSELATVGVRPAFRRRGVAGAVTSRLAREAFAAGIEVLWLTPMHDAGERIYSSVGFSGSSEVIHISR